jgi:hypothetical protein
VKKLIKVKFKGELELENKKLDVCTQSKKENIFHPKNICATINVKSHHIVGTL